MQTCAGPLAPNVALHELSEFALEDRTFRRQRARLMDRYAWLEPLSIFMALDTYIDSVGAAFDTTPGWLAAACAPFSMGHFKEELPALEQDIVSLQAARAFGEVPLGLAAFVELVLTDSPPNTFRYLPHGAIEQRSTSPSPRGRREESFRITCWPRRTNSGSRPFGRSGQPIAVSSP